MFVCAVLLSSYFFFRFYSHHNVLLEQRISKSIKKDEDTQFVFVRSANYFNFGNCSCGFSVRVKILYNSKVTTIFVFHIITKEVPYIVVNCVNVKILKHEPFQIHASLFILWNNSHFHSLSNNKTNNKKYIDLMTKKTTNK